MAKKKAAPEPQEQPEVAAPLSVSSNEEAEPGRPTESPTEEEAPPSPEAPEAEEGADLDAGEADPTAEPEAKAAEAPPARDQEGRSWYVIHCYSGYENRVKKTLERRIESMGMKDQIFQLVVPVEEEVELRDGKRRTVERRLFPGYVLVDMVLTEESWYVVRNTPNVTGFVGTGNKPSPLLQEQVDKILQRLESETPRVKISFRQGQKVRINEGPFADFMGTVDEIYPDKGRVRILVSIFGRETPMEVDFLQIERV